MLEYDFSGRKKSICRIPQGAKSRENPAKPGRVGKSDKDMLRSYLGELMWRELHDTSNAEALDNICRDIALRYPLPLHILFLTARIKSSLFTLYFTFLSPKSHFPVSIKPTS